MDISRYARLNICNIVKLRERPKALTTKLRSKGCSGRDRNSGKVTMLRMKQWKIRSQVLSRFTGMDAVQRLNGSGLKFIKNNFGLRYSPAPSKEGFRMKTDSKVGV